jgi:hypothetical protein
MSNSILELGGGQIEVEATCRLTAPADTVWALIGKFGAPQTWLPGIRGVELESEDVGSVRVCQTALGEFREQLTAMGPLWCTYVILEGPLPVLNYEAALIVQGSSISDACRFTWKSAFDAAPPTTPSNAKKQIAQLYNAGMRALQARFGSIDPSPLFRAGALGGVPLQTFLTI